MSSPVETLLVQIKRLWNEIETSGKDEFSTENIIRMAQIKEHQEAIKELER